MVISKNKNISTVEDFTETEPWRIFRIMSEFTDATEALSDYRPTVVFFGSAKSSRNDKYYKMAERTAALLAKHKYNIVTGGGPGIMEAANKGAFKSGGESLGLNIALPMEQKPNKYIKTLVNFHYFFIRKVMFMRYAMAFLIFPGGYGTFDELFEALTLIQTKRSDRIPVILIGSEFWRGLVKFMEEEMAERGYIEKQDLKIYKVADTPEEVLKIIKQVSKKRKHKK